MSRIKVPMEYRHWDPIFILNLQSLRFTYLKKPEVRSQEKECRGEHKVRPYINVCPGIRIGYSITIFVCRTGRMLFKKEMTLVLKKVMILVAILALSFTLATAQNSEDKMKLVKEFTLTAELDGLVLNFVALNNKTVDALFSGSGKYAIRARANASTVFYVQAVPDKDIEFNPEFRFEQNDFFIDAKTQNIKNFKAGPVAKGTRMEGLVQLSRKIDLAQPFKIVDVSNDASAEFQISLETLDLLNN